MQEMNPGNVAEYFRFLRRSSAADSHLYCVNRRRKVLPDGTVSVMADYPWSTDDEVFIDGECPYYTDRDSARRYLTVNAYRTVPAVPASLTARPRHESS